MEIHAYVTRYGIRRLCGLGSQALNNTGTYPMNPRVGGSIQSLSTTSKPASIKGQRLQFFDFATGTAKDLANFDSQTVLGLTVSPDDRYVLYTQFEQVGSDLMLVENFR